MKKQWSSGLRPVHKKSLINKYGLNRYLESMFRVKVDHERNIRYNFLKLHRRFPACGESKLISNLLKRKERLYPHKPSKDFYRMRKNRIRRITKSVLQAL